ncbi:SMP-30/gluconolactonase/LRE family protein [Hymenobacter sp. BT491]|uniref:SMP-30/gluconolactonase/LRE family protein n=1 Tax=Hymenobacter sp. BT491 TaxID=2766779 RepID=UPI00165373B4|nr:SMP-30/gluconolactonase/LRE family protein [Hymenobacter sp. BT491]MBC6991568.1 SMP-30/gluconolactonase/LRE family protein [Hymenobacter sp. BT491]
MKHRLFLFLVAVLNCGSLAAQTPKVYPTFGSVTRENPKLDQLLATDAKVEVLAMGYKWLEGPVWDKQAGYLLFSHAPTNQILKWKEGEGITEFMHPAGYTGLGQYSNEPGSNGLAFTTAGQLVLCEHGDRRISVLTKNGGKLTLADNFAGKRLNSPNDVVVRANGDVYFTDPPYGLPKQGNDPTRETEFSGVYRVTPNGQVTLLTKELAYPNGLAFSPDGKTLYVSQSDSKRAVWLAFPVLPDGNVGPSRVFKDVTSMAAQLPGSPDGFKIDQQGNLFATGPGGLHIYAPDGTLLGRIDLQGVSASNCAWGDDGSTLYITATGYLCRIRTKTKGANW